MCSCGGLWQEIRYLETAVILGLAGRGNRPKSGLIGAVLAVGGGGGGCDKRLGRCAGCGLNNKCSFEGRASELRKHARHEVGYLAPRTEGVEAYVGRGRRLRSVFPEEAKGDVHGATGIYIGNRDSR